MRVIWTMMPIRHSRVWLQSWNWMKGCVAAKKTEIAHMSESITRRKEAKELQWSFANSLLRRKEVKTSTMWGYRECTRIRYFEKRRACDADRGPSNLIFIVAHIINFRLEFLSIRSTKWLETWYSCYILANSEKILLRKVNIMACKAHALRGLRILIRSPGHIINFQLENLCNGLM